MARTRRNTQTKRSTTRKSHNKSSKEHKVITEFREMLKKNPMERMYLNLMIEQQPVGKLYNLRRLKSEDDLMKKLQKVLTTSPIHNPKFPHDRTPLSAIIIWTMGTPSGRVFYRMEKVNKIFKKIMDVWVKFLDSPKSCYVLNDRPLGWFSKDAERAFYKRGGGLTIKDYQHNPNKKYLGFTSWNNFFSRKLKPGVRPIYKPKDTKTIVSGFDCHIYKIGHNINAYDKFWIKSQPYSLMDMLNYNKKYVDLFIGGDLFQGYLGPYNYHRWHSPISGTIVKTEMVAGTYFSQTANEQMDFSKKNPLNISLSKWVKLSEDPSDQDNSQGYAAEVQTRAIIYIKSSDPKIGIICVMPIGMVEISTCVIDKKLKRGYKVKKGEEIGYFQFGGSSSCIIFQKGVINQFTIKKGFCPMGSLIAIAN